MKLVTTTTYVYRPDGSLLAGRIRRRWDPPLDVVQSKLVQEAFKEILGPPTKTEMSYELARLDIERFGQWSLAVINGIQNPRQP